MTPEAGLSGILTPAQGSAFGVLAANHAGQTLGLALGHDATVVTTVLPLQYQAPLECAGAAVRSALLDISSLAPLAVPPVQSEADLYPRSCPPNATSRATSAGRTTCARTPAASRPGA